MKKNVLFFVLISCFGTVFYPATFLRESISDFKFESKLLTFVDGKPHGVDGDVFGLLLKNRREIGKRLFGFADPSKGIAEDQKKAGMYDFCGNKYCIIDLVNIENENEIKYVNSIRELEENRSRYNDVGFAKEKERVKREYDQAKEIINTCLKLVKEDLISITKSYVDGVNRIKTPILGLIEEFCDKKGINQCFLLRWGETEAGQEEDAIRKEVLTFGDFAQFCIDLRDFLEVLARSCPKGRALFEDMIKKSQANKIKK